MDRYGREARSEVRVQVDDGEAAVVGHFFDEDQCVGSATNILWTVSVVNAEAAIITLPDGDRLGGMINRPRRLGRIGALIVEFIARPRRQSGLWEQAEENGEEEECGYRNSRKKNGRKREKRLRGIL